MSAALAGTQFAWFKKILAASVMRVYGALARLLEAMGEQPTTCVQVVGRVIATQPARRHLPSAAHPKLTGWRWGQDVACPRLKPSRGCPWPTKGQLKILKQGVAAWNEWHRNVIRRTVIQVDLSGANLSEADLSSANLFACKFGAASFLETGLSNVDLSTGLEDLLVDSVDRRDGPTNCVAREKPQHSLRWLARPWSVLGYCDRRYRIRYGIASANRIQP